MRLDPLFSVFMRGIAVLSLVLNTPSFSAPESPAKKMGLKEMVDLALAENPQMAQARAQLDEATSLKAMARSAFFPTIQGTLTAQKKKDAVLSNSVLFGGESYNHYLFNLGLTQPLIQFGIFSGLSAASISAEMSEKTVALMRRDIAARVIAAYYSVLLEKSNLDSLEEVRKVELESLQTAQNRNRIGRGQLLDVLQVKTQLALIDPQVETARIALRNASLELADLLGQPQMDSIDIRGSLAVPKVKKLSEMSALPGVPGLTVINDEKSGKLESLEAYQLSELSVELAESQKSAATGKHLPNLSAFANWGRVNYVKSDLFDPLSTNWALGLQLTIPLFSGLSSFSERHAFAARVAAAEAEKVAVVNRLKKDQAQSREELDLAEKNLEFSLQAFDLASQSLREAQKNYRLATIDYLQFLSVQQAFFQAQSTLNKTRYQLIQSIVRYGNSSAFPIENLVALFESASSSAQSPVLAPAPTPTTKPTKKKRNHE